MLQIILIFLGLTLPLFAKDYPIFSDSRLILQNRLGKSFGFFVENPENPRHQVDLVLNANAQFPLSDHWGIQFHFGGSRKEVSDTKNIPFVIHDTLIHIPYHFEKTKQQSAGLVSIRYKFLRIFGGLDSYEKKISSWGLSLDIQKDRSFLYRYQYSPEFRERRHSLYFLSGNHVLLGVGGGIKSTEYEKEIVREYFGEISLSLFFGFAGVSLETSRDFGDALYHRNSASLLIFTQKGNQDHSILNSESSTQSDSKGNPIR